MFNVVTHSLVSNWSLPKLPVVLVLLVLIVSASKGGIDRVGQICSFVIPAFLFLYVSMCIITLFNFRDNILPSIALIFKSAFKPEAALVGGVAGSVLTTMYQGIARGCYSGDIGIGYAAVVNAESSISDPRKQAQLAILGVFLDTFIVCSSTALIVITSGVWQEAIPASKMVQVALDRQFGMMIFFMPVFIFLLGYTTMIAFFVVGVKCARFVNKKLGEKFYYLYACCSFLLFSYVEQQQALTIMSLVGAMLLLLNTYGIWKLRKDIDF